MIELKTMSGDENDALSVRINAILKAALPPLRAETDPSVQINVVAMQLAIVMTKIHPDQREDFFETFAKLLWIHLESLEKHLAETAVDRFLAFVKDVLTKRGSDNGTTH